MKTSGIVSIVGIKDKDGKSISTQRAYELGIVNYNSPLSREGLEKHEIPLGYNVTTDNLRQYLAYTVGGRQPSSNYTISQYGIGTGDPNVYPPNVTDVSLIAPVLFNSTGTEYKALDGVDFPSPFVARFQYTIASQDANGYLITEFGLFTGDNTLVARKTLNGINKVAAMSLSLSWRIRL